MLGKKLSYQTNGSTVEFEFEHGTAYVTAVTDDHECICSVPVERPPFKSNRGR